ncbi:MAG: insulinase family protein [Clostridia bacterium]|nr:insulinase family protein [Clostridia bacterium]
MDFKILECKALDEKVYVYTHKSGLKIYIAPKKGFAGKCAYFAANYGSMDVFYEKDGKTYPIPDGLAHFLEHKLFESEEGDAFSKYAETGASANAFTSFGCTAYNFNCSDNFFENLKILTDLMQTPYFTKENVHKEQGIIGQEINMYLDAPDWRVYQNMIEAMYKECTVRRDIAGSVESISHITPELLYDCYNMFYAPENMVLVMVGDLDPEETFKTAEKYLEKLEKRTCPEKVYPDEPKEVLKDYTEQKLSVSFPIYMLGFKGKKSEKGKDTLRRGIIGEAAMGILFGKSSDFYLEAYDNGLINDKFETAVEICPAYGHTFISGEGGNYKEVQEKVFETIKKAVASGISDEDFSRRMTLLKSDFIRTFNGVEKVTYALMGAEFDGYNLFDALPLYDEITKDEVMQFIKEELAEDRSVLSVVLPK